MTVLHGVWLAPATVALWAEGHADPAAGSPAAAAAEQDEPGGAKAGRTPPPHPFALDGAALGRLLPELTGPEAAQRLGLADRFGRPAGSARQIVLRLPGRPDGPLPSCGLAGADRPRRGRGRVLQRPYVVPALVVQPPDVPDLLATIAAGAAAQRGAGGTDGEAAPVAGIGASLHWLREVADFTADLVRRGRVLPAAVPLPDGGGEAVWRPVLTGPDARWTRSLAAAAPPAVAAGWAAPTPPPTSLPPAVAVTAAAIDGLTDAAARQALRVWPFGYRRRAGDRPVSVAWLAALGSRQSRFEAAGDDVRELAAALQDWQGDVAAGPIRACFRLLEPGDDALVGGTAARLADDPDDDVWSLQFLLQPTDEPSLMVDAAAVWSSPAAARALSVHTNAPQDALLAELGRASRLYPPLARALRRQHPAELPLDTSEAHRFLREAAPALAAAGFGILLPAWWTSTSGQLGWQAAARPGQPGRVGTAGDAVGPARTVAIEWRLALGDAPLSTTEIEELAAVKADLIRLRGIWVEVDHRRLAAALQVVGSTGTGDVGDLLRFAAGISEAPAGLPVNHVTADGWIHDLLHGRPATSPAMSATLAADDGLVPGGFTGQLRPYQSRGLAWLRFLEGLGVGGVLADDMGLGKTVQILALAAGDGPGRRTLVVCPMSIVGTWQREAARFAPQLRVYVHHGDDRIRDGDLVAALGDAAIVLTTYTLAARDERLLRQVTWDRLVLDEAQMIKNAATKQSAALRSLPARSRFALTGTPVENRLADLWSMLDFVNPGLVGSASDFAHRYAVPIEKYADRAAAQRLRALTTPLVLRRVKTDRSVIGDLPDKVEMDVYCTLTREQASLYQATVEQLRDQLPRLRGRSRRGMVLTTLTRLKQICDHPAVVTEDGGTFAGRSGKVARLEVIVEEVLAGHEKALLFTQYAAFGRMLAAHLALRFGREVACLHGGLAAAAREELIARFQDGGPAGPPLLVASLKTGGTGLTLTAANHVVHVDRWWNPAVEDQATDRAFRIGQRRDVQVRKLVCIGTVEDRIAEMIRQKRGLAGTAIGDDDTWLADLSADALYETLRLGAEAVAE